MKNTVLIYLKVSDLKPVGGPRGYVYNLKGELDKRKNTGIHFIETKENTDEYRDIIEGMKNGNVKRILVIIKRIIKYALLFYGNKHRAIVSLDKYDYVHFHSTLDMYKVRDSLRDYSGSVILTSHSPMIFSKEIYDGLTYFEKRFFGFIYNRLEEMDEYVFNRADYLVFPCEEAEEPYYNSWNKYADIKHRKKDVYRYILTGIKPCIAKKSRKEVREKYGIPEDAFVLCYVGRHNTAKGYDNLKKIGECFLQKNNTYVLVAGKETPLTGLNNERWIEVGWTDDPHSIINSSDIFVLPNKETYFDLIMLEVLSLGKIVLASRTGGNKYFEKLKDNRGIYLYDNVESALNAINIIMDLSMDERMELEKTNIRLFNENFTCEKFADRYIELYQNLPN